MPATRSSNKASIYIGGATTPKGPRGEKRFGAHIVDTEEGLRACDL
jgi:hypothetical protein